MHVCVCVCVWRERERERERDEDATPLETIDFDPAVKCFMYVFKCVYMCVCACM